MKLTIQNRVAKEVGLTQGVRLHVRDVTNVKRSGEWLNMESKNLSCSLKVNESD